ncbi:FUSC family protein [Cysteiniphilum sp. QT6929]|uniref:FUSC family protein n=1 Tax=Cysteiniphilum sp. QT6929 TaxID=2975055 RepID=UPI0024B31FF3|nr:FUSC family protein [Cysteiniphilum sp. QT6929]WHN65782.1 FUSC family protein [Cysteiniphilum sp. QT6929]
MRLINWLNALPTYKLLAIRVASACLLAIVFTEAIGLQRNYWSVLAIISISISVHAREVLFRSKAVVINTILGCFIGTIAYYLLNLYVPFYVIITVILVLALYTLYFSVVHYAVGVFFSSIFVVMFIGTLSFWDVSLLIARILDIAIGALVILLISRVLKQRNLREKFYMEFSSVYLTHKQIIEIFLMQRAAKDNTSIDKENDFNESDESLDKEILRLLIDELALQEKHMVENFINTKTELNKAQINMIKVLLSTMRELMSVYRALLLLDDRQSNQKLLHFCRQKLVMFFDLLKNEYATLEKMINKSFKEK